MKVKVKVGTDQTTLVTAEELPVGRASGHVDHSVLLKISETLVLVVNGKGEIFAPTDPRHWNVPRPLLPEGTSITITT